MAAPEYVPNTPAQQPRRGLGLPPARPWTATRPGELGPEHAHGGAFGDPGPDQGYALVLAQRFTERLVLDGVRVDDAIAGCLGVGLKRASQFGRAPVIHDMDIAFRIWGFLGGAPVELVALRNPLFEAASHHYWDQRDIVGLVPDSTLLLSHQAVAAAFPTDWRALVGTDRRGHAA
jgi:hypothetical protein